MLRHFRANMFFNFVNKKGAFPMIEIKPNDCFYDIESLENIFTLAIYYPAKNNLIIYYLESESSNLTESKEFKDSVKKEILDKNPNFKNKKGKKLIEIKNMKEKDNLKSLIETFGISYTQEKSISSHEGLPASLYPIKNTDLLYKKDKNDKYGKFFGYNSEKYDLTILAMMFWEYVNDDECIVNKQPKYKVMVGRVTPELIRHYNDQLFDEMFKSNMPRRLAMRENSKEKGKFEKENYSNEEWTIRKSWLLTGRFIDVAKLNEKMQKVALKRLLGMLGYQILESENLTNNPVIKTTEEMLDLFAYNASDVINLYELLKHPEYQASFQVKEQILEDYKELIYTKKKDSYEADESPENIRRDRLNVDTTSANFVTNSLCPYPPALPDIKAVSFMYPEESVCKANGFKQFNVLEELKNWFMENVPDDYNAHEKFNKIYHFYKEIEGKNFNKGSNYQAVHGNVKVHDQTALIKDLQGKYNCNFFYKDKDGKDTSCFVTFSIGGIHGQEINQKEYQKDLEKYELRKKILDKIKETYNNDPEKAYADVKEDKQLIDDEGNPIFYKNGKPRTKKIDKEITIEDKTIKLKDFVKKSKDKYSFIGPTRPKIFNFSKDADINGTGKINKKYVYTSTGLAIHMDFTSYYPLLLTMMNAFYNESLGEDRYFEIFKSRKKYKKMAKDKSYSEEERDFFNLIQNGKKLILNSASGIADGNFETNILMTNKIISMRIIGQLFSFWIGQALALKGARVVSTNTDGLYTMGLDEEINNKTLEETARNIHIEIEPENVQNFISKDSNNRIEFVDNKIAEAKGGTLTSWQGPSPGANLDHPAIIDYVLARYLTTYENAVNKKFNEKYVRKLFSEFWDECKKNNNEVKLLNFLQMIVASSEGTKRYVYGIDDQNNIISLQNYNRVFLVKDIPNSLRLKIATKRKVDINTYNKRINNDEIGCQHDEDAKSILTKKGYTLKSDDFNREEASSVKIKGTDESQKFLIVNNDLRFISKDIKNTIENNLDADAYIEMVKNTFLNSWYNGEANA